MFQKQPSGRVYGVFGLPCSGKTTLLQILVESSRELVATISTGDIARKLSTPEIAAHMAAGNLFPLEDKLREEVMKTVNARRAAGAELIFLDGFPRFDDQVRWLLANQLIGHGEGGIIQIIGENLEKRAVQRSRDENDTVEVVQKRIKSQQEKIYNMEKFIHSLGLTYFCVMNNDLERAAVMLSKYVGLTK